MTARAATGQCSAREKYAPVGAVVYNAYWAEHYTVLAHNADGSITVQWHGDARCANPQPARRGTHRTPLNRRDRIIALPVNANATQAGPRMSDTGERDRALRGAAGTVA